MIKRVYFDHAATSWPRLPGVVEAMSEFERTSGASAGRGSYSSTTATTSRINQLRVAVSRLVNASANDVAFFSNGTMANNYALAGLLRGDDHVVTTSAEHNSVLRPLRLLEVQRGITWTAVDVDNSGRVDPSHIENAIRPNTRMIVCTSASNVTGSVNDLSAIGKVAAKHGLIFMVDAAQTLGYLPIDMSAMQIDVLAAPGHKGAGGPLGTGVLIASEKLHRDWQPLWIGGTGEMSSQLDGEFDWQQVAESGNRNSTALVGWLAGIKYLLSLDQSAITEFDRRRSRLHEILSDCPLGTIIGHADGTPTVPVFSLNCSVGAGNRMSPGDWAALLDSSFQIEVRSGLHCAAMVHKFLGTDSFGGTLRFSIGHTTNDADLDKLENAIEELKHWNV